MTSWPSTGPDHATPKPQGVFFYQLYAAFLALIYTLTALMGVVMLSGGLGSQEAERAEQLIYGVAFLGVSLPLMVASAATIFLPRRPWAWVCHVIMIALGTSSCCLLPFSIVLLIKYLEPDVKRYFGTR